MTYNRIQIPLSKGRGLLEYSNKGCRLTLQLQGLPVDRLLSPCILWENSFLKLPYLNVDKGGSCSLRCMVACNNPQQIKAVGVFTDNMDMLTLGYLGEPYNWQQALACNREMPQKEAKAAENEQSEGNNKQAPENKAEPNKENAPVNKAEPNRENAPVNKAEPDKENAPVNKAVPESNSPQAENEPTDSPKQEAAPGKTNNQEPPSLKSLVYRFSRDLKELMEYMDAPVADAARELIAKGERAQLPFEGNWVKISLRQLSRLGNLWRYSNNPLVVYGCKAYHHLLLGERDGLIYLAVPWQFNKDYRLEAEIQGFNRVLPLGNMPPKEGELCYLLMNIN